MVEKDPVQFWMAGFSTVGYLVGLAPEEIALRLQKQGIVYGEMPDDSCASWKFSFPYVERERVLQAIGHPPTRDSLGKAVYIASFYTHLFPGRFSDYGYLGANHLKIDDGLVGRILTEILFEGVPQQPKVSLWDRLRVSLSSYF